MRTCSDCGAPIETAARFCPSCGLSLVEGGQAEPLIGRVFNGKYRVLARIGAGGMGTVYLGEHIGLRKKVALKVLKPELQVTEDTLRRFQREGIAAGQFTHAAAIQIFDFDRADGGVFYLAMEYVEGTDLKAYLRRHERLEPERALAVTQQVLAALAEAHRHGIVHRDLKPENIMVSDQGSGSLSVKVLDFGLSKLIDLPPEASMHTQFGQIVGTPLYMAPEQCSAQPVDHRTDLYAVGLILYELVAGGSPFRGRTVAQLLAKHALEPPRSISEEHPELALPAGLDEVLAKALEQRPEDRYQSALEMSAALAAIDPSTRVRGRGRRRKPRARAGAGAGLREGGRRRGLLLGVAVLALAVVGSGLAWMWTAAGSSASAARRVSEKPAAERSEEERRYVSLLDEARSLLAAGDARGASARVEEAHRLACRDADAYLVRARVYRARNDLDPALADLREAQRLDPEDAAAVSEEGWLELERDEAARAREAFERARALEPGAASALAGLGAVARRQGEAEEARALLERAVALDPQEASAQRELGLLRLGAEDLSGAVAALTEAKRLDPRSWRTWAALGEAYLGQGRPLDAEAQLAEAHALAPDEEGPLALLCSLLCEAGRHVEALELLRPALQRHPRWGRAQVLAGIALQAGGDTKAAIAALERAREAGVLDARATTLLGILRQRAGALEEAVSTYAEASSLDRSFALPHLDRGLALFALGRYEEAASALHAAAEVDATDAFARRALGVLYMDYLNDRRAAVENLGAARELGGEDPELEGWLRRLGAQ